jgi:hypothetical protein
VSFPALLAIVILFTALAGYGADENDPYYYPSPEGATKRRESKNRPRKTRSPNRESLAYQPLPPLPMAPPKKSRISMTLSVGQNISLSNSNLYGPSQGYQNSPYSNQRTLGPPGMTGTPPRNGPMGGGMPGGGMMGGGMMPGGGMMGGGMMMGGPPMEGGGCGMNEGPSLSPLGVTQMNGLPGNFPNANYAMGTMPAPDDAMMMEGPMGGGGPMMMMGGGSPMSGGMMGGMGGGGTATTLSARLNYLSAECFGLSASIGTSIPEGNSGDPSMPTSGGGPAGGGNTTLSATATYSTKTVSLGFTVMALVPTGSGTQSFSSGNTGPNSGLASGNTAQTSLMPSVRVRATDKLTLGVSLSHQINYQGADDTYAINGPRTPGYYSPGLTQDLLPDTTILSTSAGYAISKIASASISAPIGFSSGFFDPTGGLNLNYRLMRRRLDSLSLNLGIQGSAPLSTQSRQQLKITTLTGSIRPNYRYDYFSFGLASQVSYSFYQYPYQTTANSAVGSTSPMGNAVPDQLSTMTNANIGFRLSRQVSTSSTGGVNFLSHRDGTVSWGTQAVPLALTYRYDAFSISGNFSLRSDPLNTGTIVFPNQPSIGGSISYTFGDLDGPGPGGPPR